MSHFKPDNIIFNNNKDSADFIQCVFELTLTFLNKTSKIFREIAYSKYCNLITPSNSILFNEIESYKLKISIYKFIKNTYIVEKNMNKDDPYIFKNDDIYIEIMKNEDGLANCCCNLVALDNNRVFITPPDY